MINTLLGKILVLISLLFVLSCAFSSNTHEFEGLRSTANNLPYQAHSFNDLNYTRNLLLKKTKYFKFDASLANKPSCQTYSTWDGKNPCFNSTFYADEMCCIAMRGDASSQPNFNYHFNTSDEFVALFDSFLSKHEAQVEITFVAIDIQFGFEFKNKIAEGFIYKLAQLMNKYKKLYVTVKGDFILEYDRVCRHSSNQPSKVPMDLTNQVGEEACTVQRKIISDSRFFLQSGSMDPEDSRDYKSRFRNFNTIYKEIDRLCRDGFPTWPNKYPEFPLIFWEPSNEDQVLSSLKKLMAPQCQRKHNRTLKGIAFASNIDPEMFQTYMKPLNLKSLFPWSYIQEKLWLQEAISVKMTRISGVNDNNQSNSQDRLIIYVHNMINGTIGHFLHVLSLNDQTSQIKLEKVIELSEEVAELHGIEDKIIVISKKSEANSREFDAIFSSYNSKLELLKTREIASYIDSYVAKNMVYYITRTSSPTYFNMLYMPADLSTPQPYGISYYMPSEQINAIKSIYFYKGQSITTDILFILGDSGNQTWMAQMKNGNIHKIKTLTYGTNANVVTKYDGRVLILLENSYSHSGLLLNNNANNKCMLHKSANLASLASVPNLINVIQGSIDDYMNFFNAEDNEIVTACHPDLSFSKYMNGHNSEIVSIWGSVLIATKYVPINKQDLMGALFCGASNYDTALLNKNAYIVTSTNGNNKWLGPKLSPNIVEE